MRYKCEIKFAHASIRFKFNILQAERLPPLCNGTCFDIMTRTCTLTYFSSVWIRLVDMTLPVDERQFVMENTSKLYHA
jgi:hypothetical protein